ncbi:MAG: AraC family transcriptional regulator ligand-binding domain-containing protein [Pseudomonadota bacterium]
MGDITSLFAHKVVAAASANRPDADTYRKTLLTSIGLDPNAPIEPKTMVPDTAYYALCERAAREDADGPSLPVRVGALMRSEDYGAFGLAWKAATSLRGSFHRAERYGRVLTSVSRYEVREEGGTVWHILHRDGPRTLGMRLSNEQTIVATAQIAREVAAQPVTFESIHFKHDAPTDIAAHEAFFRCPVVFASDRDALALTPEAAATPNRLGDESMLAFFDAHLDTELAALSNDSGLAKRVRIQVSQALSEGVPAISETASRLGMSPRTLQRRLADLGETYQDLVDAARRELAEKLLRETDYALAEVAFLTGFSEQSAFTRAFKRWRGQTPRSYRLGS